MEISFFFLVKKGVATLLDPVLLGFVLLMFTLLFRVCRGNKKIKSVLVLSVIYWCLSAPLISQQALWFLEKADLPAPQLSPEVILVLGSGHIEHPEWPLSSQYQESSLRRIVHAVLLKSQYPDAEVYFSGGKMPGRRISESVNNARLAILLGMPEQSIRLAEVGHDTLSELTALHDLLNEKRVVVVSSAGHLPRVDYIARKMGMSWTYSATDHKITALSRFNVHYWTILPSRQGLSYSAVAFYEFASLALLRVQSFID